MKIGIKWLFSLLFLLFALSSWGQLEEEQDSTGSTTIIIEHSDNTVIEKENEIYIKYLNGNVRVIHDSTFFYCDTAIIKENDLLAFGNVVIYQEDSTTLFSDSLYYNADSLNAFLSGKVLLDHKGKELRTKYLEYDVDIKQAYYETGAVITQDSTTLKSLHGLYDINEDMIYFKDFVSIEDSSFHLNADSLKYDTRIKTAYFTGPTLIKQDSSNIYSEAGFYDIEKGNAEFSKNVKYLENDTKATALVMRFHEKEDLIILAGDAYYVDDKQEVSADSIHYYRNQETSIMMGNVNVLSEDSNIEGNYLIYDHESGDFKSTGRSTIIDQNIQLSADLMDFEDKGEGRADGNIVLIDTSSNTRIYSDHLLTKDGKKSFFAYSDSLNMPIMEKVMDSDTLFLSADTLYSFEQIIERDSFTITERDTFQFIEADTLHIIEQDTFQIIEADTLQVILRDTTHYYCADTVQVITAYYNVRIFHPDYQGIADSLSYNNKDSIFQLFHSPILWSDTTQFAGDSISIYLKKDKIDQLHLRPNASLINVEAGSLYNQIGGKDIRAHFRDDSLRLMQSSGNAESIYYMKDEDGAYMGAVKTISSKMNFYFEKNELLDIKYLEDPVSKMTPIKKELNLPQRLKSFKWELDKRPPNKEALERREAVLVVRGDEEVNEVSEVSEEGVGDKEVKKVNAVSEGEKGDESNGGDEGEEGDVSDDDEEGKNNEEKNEDD